MSAPAPAPAPAKRRDVALLVFVGVVVLVVVGSLVSLTALSTGSRSPANRSAAAVKSYLDALAAGDSAKALSYAATPPADPTLLTDEVLAANAKRAPLADVQATAQPGSESSVDVTYTLGGQPVTDRYTTSRVDGAYKLDRVSTQLSFVTVGVDRLPLLANGVQAASSTVELFPGSYAFTTGLPNVDWGDDTETTVTIGGSTAAPALKPRVTDAGRQAFLGGAKKLISACTAQRQLSPDDCPFGFRQPSSGPRIPDSTVRWKLKNNPWSALDDPTIESFTSPGLAKARTSMTFTCTCRFSTGEACRPQDVTNTVTFAGDVTTDPMKVVLTTY